MKFHTTQFSKDLGACCPLRDNMHAYPIRAVRARQSTVQISSVMDGANLFGSEQIWAIDQRARMSQMGLACMLSYAPASILEAHKFKKENLDCASQIDR